HVRTDTTNLPTTPVKDRFAPAQFTTMKDSQKLSAPSFQQMESGFALSGTADLTTPAPVNKSVDYELSYLRDDDVVPAGTRPLSKGRFRMARQAIAATNAGISKKNRLESALAPTGVVTQPEEYVIASVSDMKAYAGGYRAGSYAEALQQMATIVAEQPELTGQLQVLSTLEVGEP
ncbi:MAG TPA: hypothetical protein VNH46_11445, partial [Gemmatimonadales bacterium]|nr:hypothetical protein [Gemmatimonadales bacterium]